MDKFLAEFVGTLILVLFGCGAAVIGGAGLGHVGISLAFGFAIVAAAYAIGPVSGAHVNPAVSLAVYLARRMTGRDLLIYWVAQFAGALAGALLLAGLTGDPSNLGQNGWGPGKFDGYPLASAALFEVTMTAIFTLVVLGATGRDSAPGFAGLAIGLTLAAIHIVGIPVTGVSVNPARSFGPAVLAGGDALSQLWLFIFAPALGAMIGAALFRFGLLAPRPAAAATADVTTIRGKSA